MTIDEDTRCGPVADLLRRPPEGSVRRLAALLATNPRSAMLAFAGTCAVSFMSLFQPDLTGRLIESLQQLDGRGSAQLAATLTGVTLTVTGLTAAVNLVSARAGNGLVRALRDESAALALRVPAQHLVEHPAADLGARSSVDADRLADVFLRGPVQAVGGALLALGSLGMMVRIDPVLAGAAVALSVLSLASVMLASRRMTAASFERQVAHGAYVAEVTRAMDSLLILRAYVAAGFAMRRLASSSRRLEAASNRTARVQAFLGPLVTVLAQATIVALVILAFLRVQSGALAVDSLVAFFLYVMLLIGPMTTASETVVVMAQTMGAFTRLTELAPLAGPSACDQTDASAADAGAGRSGVAKSMRGELTFRNVTVGHPGTPHTGRPRLADVTFDVPPGSWTVLTGASGSGKTTVLSLLAGFITPDRGLTLVDGEPISAWEERAYRAQIGYVDQACPLFPGTVRDNLLLGRTGITDDECWAMLERIGLIDAVRSRRAGLAAPVGESASSFSGGERQRLAIARALLRKPRLLLLDEVTSGLDVVNRHQIIDLIKSMPDAVTTVAAEHGRFGTQGADQVLVLESGRLVESGSPSELTVRSPLFRTLTCA